MGLLADECAPEYEQAYQEVVATWDKSVGTSEQRFWLVQEALETICERLCPECVTEPVFDAGPEVFPLFHFAPGSPTESRFACDRHAMACHPRARRRRLGIVIWFSALNISGNRTGGMA